MKSLQEIQKEMESIRYKMLHFKIEIEKNKIRQKRLEPLTKSDKEKFELKYYELECNWLELGEKLRELTKDEFNLKLEEDYQKNKKYL